MKQFLFAVIILFSACNSNTQSTTFSDTTNTPVKIVADTIPNWTYTEDIDKMDNSKQFGAGTNSLNELQFQPPYDGGSKFFLVIRKGKDAPDVYIRASKGQFITGIAGETKYRLKFDDEKPINVSASFTDDGRADIAFLSPANKIIEKLKHSNKLIIEAIFYQEGYKTIEFNVSSFKWEH